MLFVVCFALLVNHASPGQENNSKNLRFVVYGDTRRGGNRTDLAARARVVEIAIKQEPAFIVQTGDLVQYGNDPKEWAEFDRLIQPIRDQHIAYYPAKGNHDSGENSKYSTEILDPVQAGDKEKNYYRVDVQGLRFIALDTESLSDAAIAIDEYIKTGSKGAKKTGSKGVIQYKWLKDQLEQAKADKAFVIPFFHRALFSVGFHGNDVFLQSLLHPLFKQYGVRLVFQGHDHLYYRTVRDGITYVVTGGGGAPLYDVKMNTLQKNDIAKKVHHLCAAELSSDDVHFTIYEVDGSSKKKDPVEPIDDYRVSLAVDSQE
jgi:3',5'-cyclic AMP phosphodiesterase CpdA